MKIKRKKPVYGATEAEKKDFYKKKEPSTSYVLKAEEKKFEALEQENQLLRNYIINEILDGQVARERRK